jgi:hypothetical protein
MAELQIEELKLPAEISFNYEELKAELTEKVKHYEAMIYDDTQIKEAKADRANLNRLKKALNDERIKREKEYMAPFNEFKTKINEIIAIIDKPVALIDRQVKEFEEQQKNKKAEEIQTWFDNNREELGAPEWLRLKNIGDTKWLNASASLKSIQEEIAAKVDTIKAHLETIQSLPEFSFEAAEVYKTSLDINRAIAEGKRLADIQKRKQEAEERAKAEAEAKAQEESQKQQEAPQEEPQPQEEPKAEAPKAQAQWVKFQALLTVEQAKALKAFFESNNIEFKTV